MNGDGGFSYEVSDEQIAIYSALPIDRRVRWVEEHARMTYALATKEVREHWSRLRRGLDPLALPSAVDIRDLTHAAAATLEQRTARIEIED